MASPGKRHCANCIDTLSFREAHLAWLAGRHRHCADFSRDLGSGAARRGKVRSFTLWVDVQKLCSLICVLSLSWNFFVSHDKYIARPSSKEPR